MADSNLTSTGAVSKARIKTGDQLIPKTSWAPLAAPGKLMGLKVSSAEELLATPRWIHQDIMRIFLAAQVPCMLWGPPGSGKTRNIEAMANECDEAGTPYQVITVQPSTEDPTTMYGLIFTKEDPRTGETISERSIPGIADRIWKYFNNKDGISVILLDEITTCSPAQQAALLGLVSHGKFGQLDLNPYMSIVMAANPPGTVSTVTPVSEALLNRCGHIPWYSDRKHYIPNWSSGFGVPSLVPKERTRDFVQNLIACDPDIAFRDDPTHHDSPEDGWDVDNLCPFDQILLSERSITEGAKVYELMSETFADAPFDVRKLYIQEGIKAMLGPRWSHHAGTVEEKLESRLDTKPIIDAATRYGIKSDMSTAEVVSLVGDRLHRLMGKRMRAQQELELAEVFSTEIFADDAFSQMTYLAFWMWLSTSPDEGTRAPVIPVALNILSTAIKVTRGQLPEQELLPKFVPPAIHEEMRVLRKRAS